VREKYTDDDLKIKMRCVENINHFYNEITYFVYFTISLTNDKSKKISGIIDFHNLIYNCCGHYGPYKLYIERNIDNSLNSFLLGSAKAKDFDFVTYLKNNYNEKIKDVISCFIINKVSKIMFGF